MREATKNGNDRKCKRKHKKVFNSPANEQSNIQATQRPAHRSEQGKTGPQFASDEVNNVVWAGEEATLLQPNSASRVRQLVFSALCGVYSPHFAGFCPIFTNLFKLFALLCRLPVSCVFDSLAAGHCACLPASLSVLLDQLLRALGNLTTDTHIHSHVFICLSAAKLHLCAIISLWFLGWYALQKIWIHLKFRVNCKNIQFKYWV